MQRAGDKTDENRNEADRHDRKPESDMVQQICSVSKMDGAMRNEMTRDCERKGP